MKKYRHAVNVVMKYCTSISDGLNEKTTSAAAEAPDNLPAPAVPERTDTDSMTQATIDSRASST